MASIGLRRARYNKINQEKAQYEAIVKNVPVLGRLIDAKINENRSNVKLYADDHQVEKVNEFAGATLNLTLDDVTDETYTDIKGCSTENEEITENSEDTSPEIGYGHIVTKIYEGKKKYKVEFLPRIQITKVTADRKTKGESVEFNTVSIEADVMELAEDMNGMKKGTWKIMKTFDTLKEAEDYLETLLKPKEQG